MLNRRLILRKLVVVWFVLFPLAGYAASGDEFYQRLYQRGMAHFTAGDYASAFTELRNAAFGLVEQVELFETVQSYAIISAHRLERDNDARDSLMRIVSAEKVQPHFRAIKLPDDVRAEVNAVAASLLTAEECNLLGVPASVQEAAAKHRVVVPTPTKKPNVAVTAPRERRDEEESSEETRRQTTTSKPASPAPQPPAPVPQQPVPQPVTPAPQPVAPVPQPRAVAPQPVPQPVTQPATPAPKPQPTPKSETPAPQPRAAAQQPVPQPVPPPVPQPVVAAPQPLPVSKPETPAPQPRVVAPQAVAPQPVMPQPVAPVPQPKPAPQPAPPPRQTAEPQPAAQPVVKDVDASLAEARRAIEDGEIGRARSIYGALLSGPQLPHAAALQLAEGLYRVHDFGGATRAFQRAGALVHGEEQYHYYYAVSLYETGRYVEAKRELAVALPYVTANTDVMRYRAKIEGAIE